MSAPPLAYSDPLLRGVLGKVRSIAVVGASGDWKRPSFFVMKYLQKKGYRILPVNPGRAGQTILGETVYAGLADLPAPVDMVDVFRNSDDALAVAEEAVSLKDEKGFKVLWMQLGVRNDEAARRAEAAGLTVIMDRCPKIEYARLSGDLGWCGVNTRIVTAKRLRAPGR